MIKTIISVFVINIILFGLTPDLSAQERTANLAGTVKETKSGEYVIGITVTLFSADTLKGWKVIRGAYTNKYGFYSIPDVEPGKYLLSSGGIGYKKFITSIELKKGQEIRLNIDLEQTDIKTADVIIEAEKSSNPTKDIGTVEISPSFVEKMPSLGGEKDLFRVLQLLPGVQQATEMSSGLYVRGGTPDQVLYLLDGVTVYNPSHVFGFLSTFNNDALKDVKLIKGPYPAEYGGRLSSILDISMKEGTKEKFSGAGGISTLSSRLTLEGPIGDDITYMISGRRFYHDLYLQLFIPDEESAGYYFYDLNAKINYEISESDRIFLSGYFGRDVLYASDDNDFDMDFYWGNKTGNLRWMHIVSPTLFTNFSLIYTDYNYNIDIIDQHTNTPDSLKEVLGIFSGIRDLTLKGEVQYFPAENHIVKTGIETTWHIFDAYAQSDFFDDFYQKPPKETIKALDAAFFIQDEWEITPLLPTNIGCRFYYFQQGNYLGVEPRISASYFLTEDVSFFGAAALTNQFLHLLIRNDITLPTDLWFPSTDKVKPSQAWQGVLGLQYLFGDGQYRFTTEAYYKKMTNIYDYRDDADFNFGVPIQEQFTTGWGEAYGLELFLHKRFGSFTGWIGYTLSWVTHHFDDLNDGKPFSPRYDLRNDIGIVLAYELSEHWEIGASWVFRTGQAYTMPTGVYSFSDPSYNDPFSYWFYEKYQYTERNGFRLPSYHRLDVNFMYKYEWFGIPFELAINIYNLYNQKNPFAWYITSEWDERTMESKKVVKQITLFPIIPTIGINFKF
jgi:hypothetical protein